MSHTASAKQLAKSAAPKVTVRKKVGGYAVSFEAPKSPTAAHEAALGGLPVALVGEIARRIGLNPEGLAQRIGISRATYHRRMQAPKSLLSSQESDALLRYGMLSEKALSAFDADEAATRQWLNTAQPGLGNAVPVDFAQTSMGYGEVEKLLTRIDLGVYA
jgi:putative toxin-antitoxin system antitoxin component (TIGR02293 family)